MTWKTLETRIVYDNPWITVKEDKVINPGGGHNDYGHIHFKKKAIAIVPLDDNGNTWIVGQDRYTLGEYSWELPMGASEAGDTSNSVTDEVGFVFVAEGLSEGDTQFDEMEVLDIRKLPLEEVVAMIGRGEMTDAISVAAVLRVWLDQIRSSADTT